MNDLATLWHIHREAQWPKLAGPLEGELMTLDTVISGCVTYYLEERALDAPRIAILEDCLDDLSELLPDLPDHACGYFGRLHHLATLLLTKP
jgi:hypothetical protein